MVRLLDAEPTSAARGPRFAEWIRQIEHWRETEPLRYADRHDAILPQYAIQRLWQILRDRRQLDDTIITTGDAHAARKWMRDATSSLTGGARLFRRPPGR